MNNIEQLENDVFQLKEKIISLQEKLDIRDEIILKIGRCVIDERDYDEIIDRILR